MTPSWWSSSACADSADPTESGRALGRIYRQLHLDEIAGSVKLAEQALAEAFAVLTGRKVKRISRLWLIGYRAVQEASVLAAAARARA